MNNNIAKGNWNELKGKIKAKWGKFTDDDIETFNGNLDQIKGKLQKAYGYQKDRAEKEYNDFTQSMAGKANDAFDTAKKDDTRYSSRKDRH
jgi:uncharacterized protein YjbJ (UPF0337 family)